MSDVNVRAHLKSSGVPDKDLDTVEAQVRDIAAHGLNLGQLLGWISQYGPGLLQIITTVIGTIKPPVTPPAA